MVTIMQPIDNQNSKILMYDTLSLLTRTRFPENQNDAWKKFLKGEKGPKGFQRSINESAK